MVHRQVIVPILKAAHLIKLVGACHEESFVITWEVYLLYQKIAFYRWVLYAKSLHSVKSFRYIKENSSYIFRRVTIKWCINHMNNGKYLKLTWIRRSNAWLVVTKYSVLEDIEKWSCIGLSRKSYLILEAVRLACNC